MPGLQDQTPSHGCCWSLLVVAMVAWLHGRIVGMRWNLKRREAGGSYRYLSWMDHGFWAASDGIWWHLYRLPSPPILQPGSRPRRRSRQKSGSIRVERRSQLSTKKDGLNWVPRKANGSSFYWDIPCVSFGETQDARLGSIACESVGVRSWFGGFEVLAVLHVSPTPQMSWLCCNAWELDFHISHPECIKRVRSRSLIPRPKWFSQVRECGKANNNSSPNICEKVQSLCGIGLTCIPSSILEDIRYHMISLKHIAGRFEANPQVCPGPECSNAMGCI